MSGALLAEKVPFVEGVPFDDGDRHQFCAWTQWGDQVASRASEVGK